MNSRSKQINRKTTFADWLLILTLVVLSSYSFIFVRDVMPQGSEVRIEVEGKPRYILPLSVNKTITVGGLSGNTIIEINNNKVRIKDSPCPNKLCIHQGWIDTGAIVCLPNRVLVIITAPDIKKDLDGITG